MPKEAKIKFDIEDVDINDIMKQIHDNMKTRGYDIEEMKKLSKGINIRNPIGPAREMLDTAAAALNCSYNIQYWWEIPSQSGIKGKLRVFFNKLMRKFTFFYMKHVFDQQNIFNANATCAINELKDTCNHLKEENNDLLMRIASVSNEHAALYSSLQKLTVNLDQTMSKYVDQVQAIEGMYAERQNQIDSICTSIAARLHRIETSPVSDTSMEASKELAITAEQFLLTDSDDVHDFDYFLFESKHRGSTDEIKKRQEHYLQYFSGQENVLDLGCGRGEFLELLSENGISAKGVDILPENIKCCEEKNIAAVIGDGIEYLRNCEDESLGGIFSAQVIEHISTDKLIELIRLARKKLKPGSNLILETLNPECLMIYAQCFYLDPTHTKPVHPQAVKFIAECEGFPDSHIIYMTPTEDNGLPLNEEHPEADSSIKAINSLIFGNREYALVAKK